MSLPTSGDLATLNRAYNGGPYVAGWSKAGFTDSLDTAFNGGPWVKFNPFGAAAANVTNVVYIKTASDTWSTGTVYIKTGASTWSQASDVYLNDGADWNS